MRAGSDSGLTAEIKAEFYDADGILMGTGIDTLRNPGPGKTGAFEVVYSGDRRWDVRSYKIISLR